MADLSWRARPAIHNAKIDMDGLRLKAAMTVILQGQKLQLPSTALQKCAQAKLRRCLYLWLF
jgi:hypothetical protein